MGVLAEYRSILIYGMGMMGASLSLALQKQGYEGRIVAAVRSEKSRRIILEKQLANEVWTLSHAKGLSDQPLHSVDLVVFGLPVQGIKHAIAEFPPTSCLLTDMSSTRRVVEEAASARPDLRFVGSHPMCGSEDSGPEAGRANLYEGRLCIVTENKDESRLADTRRVVAFWEALGMKTCFLAPEKHDMVLAYLSHTPHMISGLLTQWAKQGDGVLDSLSAAPIPVTGGGFRDMARIAGSNPEMWADIIETNRENIASSLEQFAEMAALLAQELRSGKDRETWLGWFRSSRKARNLLCGYPEDK